MKINENTLTNFIFRTIMGVAAQALIVSLVWGHVIVKEFGVHTLSFGEVFVIVIAIRVLLCELFNISSELREIRKILNDSDENNKFQFSSVVDLLRADIKDREKNSQ